ncbi:MAG: SH3 domain-containing protein [Saprospiraceae bacterium]|nr:SH3 domain-containing protein [Saprospiraceae bacterium]
MKKIIKIIILILLSAKSNAEPFTILAKSGLNVRKEPNSKSERVGSLAFGTVVEAEINYETDVEYNKRYKHFSEIIEGKQGFWMKISHGKIEGYIFSGFGLIGEWVVNSTEINNDYRMLRVGQYCDAINYDPKLNWYALTKNNGKLSVKKSDVTLRLVHEFNEQDTLGEENEYWTEFPLIVQSNLKDTILFLIGTKTNFEEGATFSQFIANQWGYSENEKFLFPEQTYGFYYEGKNYQFHAFEGVKLTKDNPDGYIKKYQLELRVNVHPETKTYNLSKELQLEETAERHCNYKTPQLILVGDINKDGLPDFIYYSHTMSDSCGVCWEYHLFLSDKSNPDKPIRKVANEISCNCIT